MIKSWSIKCKTLFTDCIVSAGSAWERWGRGGESPNKQLWHTVGRNRYNRCFVCVFCPSGHLFWSQWGKQKVKLNDVKMQNVCVLVRFRRFYSLYRIKIIMSMESPYNKETLCVCVCVYTVYVLIETLWFPQHWRLQRVEGNWMCVVCCWNRERPWHSPTGGALCLSSAPCDRDTGRWGLLKPYLISTI